MVFWVWAGLGPRNCVLDGGSDPPQGALLRGMMPRFSHMLLSTIPSGTDVGTSPTCCPPAFRLAGCRSSWVLTFSFPNENPPRCGLSSEFFDYLLLGRFLRVDLITLEGEMSVRPSTRHLSDFNEIWCVHRRRWVMHDSMQYDLIQGQGHGASEVPKIALFKVCLLRHLQRELANDH